MVDLKEYLMAIGCSHGIEDEEYKMRVSKFMLGNRWFGVKPVMEQGKILVDESCLERIGPRIEEFCLYYNAGTAGRRACMENKLRAILPKTAEVFGKYCKASGLEDEAAIQMMDFLLYYLPGEFQESTDKEMSTLMSDGYDNLPKVYGDILADFANWTKAHTKTFYKNEYFMNAYSSKEEASEAYDPYDYLKILYHLYNSDYIEENDMYTKAAKSRNYVDTWLFLSLHFLCSLRTTDLVRLPHPRLSMEPKEVLAHVECGSFPDEDARATLYTIIWHLSALMLTPHKTEGAFGVSSIKFHVPESAEVHIGTLFSVAEAHFQIKGLSSDEPLVRRITTYEQISRNMGDEIGDLFLESNFHARSANKAYMQMIFLLTDDILGVNDEFRVKGYILAALARSHKGSYGQFAKTTSVYLRDAKMNGFTPEFVAKELFERGVLSFIPSMLLKIITGGEYQKLSVENQTKLIRTLNMTPLEIEKAVGLMQDSMKQSVSIVDMIYKKHDGADILNILHRIGNGEAVSKQENCMCVMTAMDKLCPYSDNRNCPGCEYEISTKMTMFLMVSEYKRLLALYRETNNELQKKRYKAITSDVILPAMEEMIRCIEEQYGKDAVKSLEEIIWKVNNGEQ